MRVAFTGAHSTGKTTLAKALKSDPEDWSIDIIQGVVRKVIVSGHSMGKEADVESYAKYVALQLREERIVLGGTSDIILSDRTVFDALAYASVNLQWTGATPVSEHTIDMLREIWIMESLRYDFYVYFPIEFPIVPDGIRDMEEEYRRAVDRRIRQLLLEFGMNYLVVSGSVEERLLELKSTIRERGV